MSETIPADMGLAAIIALSHGVPSDAGDAPKHMKRPSISGRALQGVQGPTLPNATNPKRDTLMHVQGIDTAFGKRMSVKGLRRRTRKFTFNRELDIRITQSEDGWHFDSDEPELFGFGRTPEEADESFCFCFAHSWDQIACEDDSKLDTDAQKLKRELLGLVRAQTQDRVLRDVPYPLGVEPPERPMTNGFNLREFAPSLDARAGESLEAFLREFKG
jgi:hypothetical protein